MAWHCPQSLRLGLAALACGVAGWTADIRPAQALIEYPYCMKIYGRGGWYTDCSFSNYAQCQASASGRSAECYRDPFYRGAPGTPYVKIRPKFNYSPYGSNIDPNYNPYSSWEQQWKSPQRSTPHHRRHKKTTQ